jgi:hypothetical protein
MENPTQTVQVLAAQKDDQLAFETLVILNVVGEQIGSLVAFLELSSLSAFTLPPTLASP